VKAINKFYGKSVTLAFFGMCWLLPKAMAQGGAGIPIKHFIFIIQENHSFDNYFGTFPGANGIPGGNQIAGLSGRPPGQHTFSL
jgi:phospholipase C